MQKAVNWSEIFVADFAPLKTLHEAPLDMELGDLADDERFKHAASPIDDDPENRGVDGSVAWGERYRPSKNGTFVYLNGGEDFQVALDRVEPDGGKVLRPKKPMGEIGSIAVFGDPENDHLAPHPMK